MNYENIKLKKEYLGGISFTTHSSRKYKYTIKSKEHKILNGRTFFGETHTEKDMYGFHSKGESIYYVDNQSKEYKSIKWLLKSMC